MPPKQKFCPCTLLRRPIILEKPAEYPDGTMASSASRTQVRPLKTKAQARGTLVVGGPERTDCQRDSLGNFGKRSEPSHRLIDE